MYIMVNNDALCMYYYVLYKTIMHYGLFLHNKLCKMYTVLWTYYVQIMDMVKVIVDHRLGLMSCCFHSLLLFMIMIFIDLMMYEFCTGYELCILDFACHIMILDHFGRLLYWSSEKTDGSYRT
jgi:hypothetical protein